MPTLPRSAEVYAVDQRAEIGAAVSAVKRIWGRMGDNFDVSYLGIEPSILAALDGAQERVTVGALDYIPAVLTETGQTRALMPRYEIPAAALVGTAGNGYGTDTLAYGAVIRAKTVVGQGSSVAQALRAGGEYLSLAVGTMLSDTGRTAEKMAAHSRPVSLYVRMLNPPSCGRCVVLAGKQTTSRTAFLRHPGCDCRNIPASESVAGDLLVDPAEHLDGLTDKELARTLGSQANAQAYRDGADINQLINAYRRGGDVSAAQVYGKTVKYTTEGTSKHGVAFARMSGANYMQAARAANPGRHMALRAPRLMPESIYQIATGKADADRLLRLYGWIL